MDVRIDVRATNWGVLKGKILLVEWKDPRRGGETWGLLEEQEHKLSTCLSVGFLLYTDEEKLSLYQSKGVDEKEVTDSITIPLANITRHCVLGGAF